jgi:plasmid stabilization system protein ParE
VTYRNWTVRLSDTAEADYDDILRWTARRFGATQAAAYGGLFAAALARLERGPAIAGMRQRDEIGAGLRSCMSGIGDGITFCFASAASRIGRSTCCGF